MGCHSSKLQLADDSIHVMLAHSIQQQQGKDGRPIEHHNHYIPRAPHPLLEAQRAAASSSSQQATTCAEESDTEGETEMDRLLYHAAHHNDTIDPRDLQEYCGLPVPQSE